jgi:predicted DNA-binding WGR domain protein
MTPVQTDIEDWLAAPEARLLYSVRLCRIDRDRNMARFYRLAVERDLFGMGCFVCEWGRIGGGGQMRMIPFATPMEATPRCGSSVTPRRDGDIFWDKLTLI